MRRTHRTRKRALKKKVNLKQYDGIIKYTEVRTFFQVRANTIDIKSCRGYKYNDAVCRLCGNEAENNVNIVNECVMTPENEEK